MPHVEFAYNRSVHSATKFSSFEIVYGFNPITPLDLIPLPIGEQVNLDGKKKADLVKQIHEKTRQNIERRTEQYGKNSNKSRKKVIFEPGDWVWLHMRKERFPEQRRSKLLPRGDGPFQVLERINDNAYKLDLPGEYGVSASFNVSDLSYFDVGDDLRTNRCQEGENDENRGAKVDASDQGAQMDTSGPEMTKRKLSSGPLSLPSGPLTRFKAKQFKEALNGLIQQVSSFGPKVEANLKQESLITMIKVLQE